MKEVIIYTDGACSGNPGAGGWAAILMYGSKSLEISGGGNYSTNNKNELSTGIESLKRLKKTCISHAYSDSAYVVKAFLQNLVDGWNKQGGGNVKKS